MKQMLCPAETKEMMLHVSETIIANKDYLTEVDSKIGDGDHGIGMYTGMTEVKKALLQEHEFESVTDVFKLMGMTMLETMGGASGVIFGAMFFGGLKGIEPAGILDGHLFAEIMRNALNYIKKKGKAEPGDKTMVDSLEPAVIAMEELDSDNLYDMLKIAARAADEGVEKTKQYAAKFGRAKSLMERSVGYQDAGATSVAIIFHSMEEYLSK